MSNVVIAEWLKTVKPLTWLYILAGGTFLGATAAFGFAFEVEQPGALPTESRAELTEEVIRAWMAMHLFASLFGAVFITHEYSTGSISRSMLLSGGRGRLFGAKVLVGTLIGVVFGIVAVGGALLSPLLLLPANDMSPVWTTKGWQTALGVFTVTVLGVPWGVMVGWILRNQVASVLVLVVLTLGVEPYLLRAVPEVAKYLLTIAMSSVYLDGKPELLGVPAALAVIAAWIAVSCGVALQTLRRRDLT